MLAGVICVVVAQPPFPAGVTAAPIEAEAAVVPCWPRSTVQVVLPTPLTAVTSKISAPICNGEIRRWETRIARRR